jgi:superkiller protein 3
MALFRAGKPAEAIACLRKSLELDPKSATAWFNLGVVLRQQGKRDEAIACFRKALELDPDLPGAKKALDAILKEKGGDQDKR